MASPKTISAFVDGSPPQQNDDFVFERAGVTFRIPYYKLNSLIAADGPNQDFDLSAGINVQIFQKQVANIAAKDTIVFDADLLLFNNSAGAKNPLYTLQLGGTTFFQALGLGFGPAAGQWQPIHIRTVFTPSSAILTDALLDILVSSLGAAGVANPIAAQPYFYFNTAAVNLLGNQNVTLGVNFNVAGGALTQTCKLKRYTLHRFPSNP